MDECLAMSDMGETSGADSVSLTSTSIDPALFGLFSCEEGDVVAPEHWGGFDACV